MYVDSPRGQLAWVRHHRVLVAAFRTAGNRPPDRTARFGACPPCGSYIIESTPVGRSPSLFTHLAEYTAFGLAPVCNHTCVAWVLVSGIVRRKADMHCNLRFQAGTLAPFLGQE